jgi:hypothetical protein
MAKEDYLEGYGQGLKRGKEGPIMGPINKALDAALGNPHESAKRGLEQGYVEMKAAKKMESNKDKIINKSDKEVKKFDENYKKGGMVKSSASKRADGIAIRGKTKGKIC